MLCTRGSLLVCSNLCDTIEPTKLAYSIKYNLLIEIAVSEQAEPRVGLIPGGAWNQDFKLRPSSSASSWAIEYRERLETTFGELAVELAGIGGIESPIVVADSIGLRSSE
jgi:hypothetical protein